jgi:hypothetical protein
MFKSKLLVAGFAMSLAFGMNAEAKLYKWVDDKGVTHYGEVVPPEYANRDRDSLNKSGMVQKRPEKVDPESIRAKEEAARIRKVENQELLEKQRRESALLNTYSNESEIDQARDRSLVLINARIESHKMLMKSTDETLDGLKKEVAIRTKEGKKIPASLSNDIAQTEARHNRYAAELTKSEAELIDVKARFENEKEIYHKLKGAALK